MGSSEIECGQHLDAFSVIARNNEKQDFQCFPNYLFPILNMIDKRTDNSYRLTAIIFEHFLSARNVESILYRCIILFHITAQCTVLHGLCFK